MSNNLENDRTVTTNKMYPIDLAPQKITIVKSVSNEVKMAHLLSSQSKSTVTLTHSGPVGLMRSAAQIISPGVASQSQMIVSGAPILQGAQIVSQGTQMMSQAQLIGPTGQMLTPATQIISQGSQLSAQVSNTNSTGVGAGNIQSSIASSLSAAQVLNVGGQLVSGTGNLVVSSSVRTLPPSVRVLPPLSHSNNRPVVVHSPVDINNSSGGVLVTKSVTSHVPRGLAAGASLAVRPVSPASSVQQGNQGSGWSGSARSVRGPWYGQRGGAPRGAAPRPPAPQAAAPPASVPGPAPPRNRSRAPATVPQPSLSGLISLPTATVLTSNSIISSSIRGHSPRPPAPAPAAPVTPRPLPLLQRNYQSKVVGVTGVGVRAAVAVGNSAPAHVYYEVPRDAHPPAPAAAPAPAPAGAPAPAPLQLQRQPHQGAPHQTRPRRPLNAPPARRTMPPHTMPQLQPPHHQPVQHKHLQHQPSQHHPAEHQSVQHQSVQHQPVQHHSMQHQPVQHRSIQHQPVQHRHLLHQSTQHQGAQHLSSEHQPLQHQPSRHRVSQPPTQLLYHTSAKKRPPQTHHMEHQIQQHQVPQHQPLQHQAMHHQHSVPMSHQHQLPMSRPLTSYAHSQSISQVNMMSAVQAPGEARPPAGPLQARPSILRKRDFDGSPSKVGSCTVPVSGRSAAPGWEDVPSGDAGGGGSTTVSAASSPAPSPPGSPRREHHQLVRDHLKLERDYHPLEHDHHPLERDHHPLERDHHPLERDHHPLERDHQPLERDIHPLERDVSPRKKPRKQILNNEVRKSEYSSVESPPSPPLAPLVKLPLKRPQLSAGYKWSWRGTHNHFQRPADVRPRDARPRDLAAIAAERHVLAATDGWKVHHITGQMDDVASEEKEMSDQLSKILSVVEASPARAIQENSQVLLELLKANLQRSHSLSENIKEASQDILRVVTKHKSTVAEILIQQTEKKNGRKCRLQS